MRDKIFQILYKAKKTISRTNVIPIIATLSLVTISLYAPETFALNTEDKIKELETLTTEVGKLSKVACYVIGTASAAIGALWSVAAQSLKVAASCGAITILTFKAPAFFAQTMLI